VGRGAKTNPAEAHLRQLKHGSTGFGNIVVAGFIPASAASHAAAHRLINRLTNVRLNKKRSS